MKGGDLHWIWSPYALYQEVDYVRLSFFCYGHCTAALTMRHAVVVRCMV